LTLDSVSAKNSLIKLFDSEAFLHFCGSYLYFGVRFLAERFTPAVPAARRLMEKYHKAESNWRHFALSTPPDVETDPVICEAFFSTQSERSPDEEAALGFLDGFLDKPLDYELWLRGLLAEPEPDQEFRFVTITRGLEQWIENRVDFYLLMAKSDTGYAPESSDGEYRAEGDPFARQYINLLGPAFSPNAVFGNSASSLGRNVTLQGRRRPQGGWVMDDPAASRFALSDLYWIARIIRATVSSSGSVSYQNISWIHLLRFRADMQGEIDKAANIFQYEEVIRSVFDFGCDLVQNAIAITTQRVQMSMDRDHGARHPPKPRVAVRFR
jgi:hypothetical protein